MNELRLVISYMNMRKLSEVSGVSYDVLRNFSCGRKEYLTDEQASDVIEAIKFITGGIR